ncbi:MAG: tetratricopeptide repeat protein [Candidatus Kerfeldbacteria bacterium]|nr:tetratricopeptide repeat protein [Candidatus Kerfeldbacteria bacterium]
MWFYIIPAVLIFASLIVIAVVVGRKFVLLKSIDVSKIPLARHDRVKRDIAEQRIQRTVTEVQGRMRKIFSPVFGFVANAFRSFYRKLIEKEKEYRERANVGTVNVPTNVSPEQVRKILEEGEGSMKGEDFQAAEKKFIDAIALDHTNIDAYHDLGELYLRQENYDFAEKSLDHALKLDPDNAELLDDLGLVYEKMGHAKRARQLVERATKREPNNPKYLDHLISVSIAAHDRFSANTAWKKLKSVNPENTKLADYEKQIGEM